MAERPVLSGTRNVPISCGAFYVSFRLAPWFGWLTERFTDRIIYGDGVFDAAACGMIPSPDSALAMALGLLLVTAIVFQQEIPFRGILTGALYAADFRVRFSGPPPAAWHQRQMRAKRFCPAVA